MKKEETKPEEKNEIEKKDNASKQLVSVDDSEFAGYLDTAKFNQLWRVAQVFSTTTIVPAQYQNKPADCFVAAQMAMRMGIDPMMFMQNTYIVQGKPGIEAKLVIALINQRGPFSGPVQWKFAGTGTTRACTAYATHKTTGEMCEATVTWEMAEKEGWTKKNGSKWQTMPDMMFRYRSATFLGRLYCPEVIMGMMTADELVEVIDEDGSFTTEKKKAAKVVESQMGSKEVKPDFEEQQEQAKEGAKIDESFLN